MRYYFSAAAGSHQRLMDLYLPLERVPQVFRDCMLGEYHSRWPDGVAAPATGGHYWAVCGLLVVSKDRQNASKWHKAAKEAAKAAHGGTPSNPKVADHLDTGAVRA